MTPERLADIERYARDRRNWANDAQAQMAEDLCAALRQAWVERDAARPDVTRLTACVKVAKQGVVDLRAWLEAVEAEVAQLRALAEAAEAREVAVARLMQSNQERVQRVEALLPKWDREQRDYREAALMDTSITVSVEAREYAAEMAAAAVRCCRRELSAALAVPADATEG
jgi:hypothetical protein